MNLSFVTDVQTTITSGLIGATAGLATSTVGGWILDAAGIQQGKDMGNDGMAFVVRAAMLAAGFNMVVRYAPATADNAYFAYVFFASNSSTNNAAIVFVGKLYNAIRGAVAPRSTELRDLQAPSSMMRDLQPTKPPTAGCRSCQ